MSDLLRRVTESPPTPLSYRIQRRLCRYLAVRRHRATIPRGLVSFTFDDIDRTAVDNADPILLGHDVRGTFYICMGLADQSVGSQCFFNPPQLARLLEHGHEIGCHSFSHLDTGFCAGTEAIVDVERNDAEFRRLFPDARFDSFAYPYGRLRLSTKAELGRRFRSLRGAREGTNGPNMDLACLKANLLAGGTEELPRYLDLVTKAVSTGTWLIFFSHEVREAPSRFGCTPELLERLLEFAVSCDTRVLPVCEALNALGVNDPMERAP